MVSEARFTKEYVDVNIREDKKTRQKRKTNATLMFYSEYYRLVKLYNKKI